MRAEDWQRIETAPKNVEVLVAFDTGWVALLSLVDCYGPTIQHPNNPLGDMQRKKLGIESCYEWRDQSGDNDQDYSPSHWMSVVLPSGSLLE